MSSGIAGIIAEHRTAIRTLQTQVRDLPTLRSQIDSVDAAVVRLEGRVSADTEKLGSSEAELRLVGRELEGLS